MAKRVQARLPDDVYEKLFTWAERLGVNASQLSGMAIQAGLDSIIRAVSPMDSLKPDQWAAIVAAMQAQGIDLDELKKSSEDVENATKAS